MEASHELTPEEQAQAAPIAAAAAEAAMASSSEAEAHEKVPKAAAAAAEKSGLKMSEEDIATLADELIERFAAMGVFESTPAPAPTPAPAQAEQAAAAEAAKALEQPRKRTIAERFAGVD